MTQPEPAEIADVLAAIQATLADHERRLYPVDRNGLPEPARRRERGDSMDGLYWHVDRWTVVALAKPTDRGGCVFVHTPHSSYTGPDGPGDVVAVPYADARQLAAAILAAVSHSEDELSKRRTEAGR